MNIDDAINIEDLHRLAKRKLPKVMFDYIEGGVEDERGLARNEAAFHKHPSAAALSRRCLDARPEPRRFSGKHLFQPVRYFADRRRRTVSAAGRRVAAGRGGARREYPLHNVGRQQCLDGGGSRVAPDNTWFRCTRRRTRRLPTHWSEGRATTGSARWF